MYSVTPELYLETAERLVEAAGDAGYFSGSVAFAFAGVACRLRCSVILYRRRESLPEGEREVVSDFVPVWWEFHTAAEGEELLNDFSFGELRRML